MNFLCILFGCIEIFRKFAIEGGVETIIYPQYIIVNKIKFLRNALNLRFLRSALRKIDVE